MSRKLTLMMIAAFVPLFLAATWLIGERCFVVTMRREQQRTQAMQIMLMEQLQTRAAALTDDAAYTAASVRLSEQMGGDVLFVTAQGRVIGASKPASGYRAMLTGERCALLDTRAKPERYAIAEPLGDNSGVTVLFIRDVRDVYALRDALRVASALVMGWLRRTCPSPAATSWARSPARLTRCKPPSPPASAISPSRRRRGRPCSTPLPTRCARRCARCWATRA